MYLYTWPQAVADSTWMGSVVWNAAQQQQQSNDTGNRATGRQGDRATGRRSVGPGCRWTEAVEESNSEPKKPLSAAHEVSSIGGRCRVCNAPIPDLSHPLSPSLEEVLVSARWRSGTFHISHHHPRRLIPRWVQEVLPSSYTLVTLLPPTGTVAVSRLRMEKVARAACHHTVHTVHTTAALGSSTGRPRCSMVLETTGECERHEKRT